MASPVSPWLGRGVLTSLLRYEGPNVTDGLTISVSLD